MSDNNDLLSSLYPFIDSKPKAHDAACKQQALLSSIAQKSRASVHAKETFFAENAEKLVVIAECIAGAYRKKGRLLCAGNGGSSCDAAHFALEFLHPVTAGRPALAAINLSQDNAMLTAVANDLGFDQVLVRQLVAMAHSNDVLVVFSTSGNSSNLVKACQKAKELGLSVIVFSGGDGGELASLSCVDHALVAQTDSVHRIQECHLTAYHILWDLVHTLLAEQR
jgi:D-sedoheptulose 7-phosphate isomerase